MLSARRSVHTLSMVATLVLVCSAMTAAAKAGANWPQLGGPDGTRNSDETNLPVKWGDESVAWRTEIKGVGQSPAAIWGERIFLTTSRVDDVGMVQRIVLCVDRNDGKVVWEQVAAVGEGEKLHKLNTWASASCAVDGERVVAFFGRAGIHCYDHDGKRLWEVDLGRFAGPWGVAASPIIVGDLVIQNCDADEDAYLVALDKKTGKQVWKTKRYEIRGWSTPMLIDAGKRNELVINGDRGIQAYNPETGKEYWFCKSFIGRGSPLPAVGHGLVFVINGKPGDIYSVRPGGEGDVTNTHMAWHTQRGGGRDLPSPVVVGDYLFVVNMGGVATCYDAPSGKELWQGRLGGNFSGAPFVAGGLVYIQSEEGNVFVVRPGKKFDIVARSKVGPGEEMFRAAPTPSEGQIFFRSHNAVYCVGKRAKG